MPLYVELRDGHSNLDLSSSTPGSLGPVLGPFIAARLLRDELRVTTPEHEYPLTRVADWTFYDGQFYSDVEIVGADQMGPARTRRRQAFTPQLAELDAAGITTADVYSLT